MTSSPVQQTVPHRARTAVLGFVLPTIVAVATFFVLRSWIPDLPARVAVHWSPGGPDGFAAPEAASWLALAIVPAAAICAGIGLWRGHDGFTRRIALAASWFLTALLSAMLLSLTAAQRGLTDARQVGDADPQIYLSMGIGLVAALVGWFVMPGNPPSDRQGHLDAGTEHIRIGPNERVMWSRVVRQRGLFAILTGAAVVTAIVLVATVGADGLFITALVYLVLFAIAVVFSSARVTVDSRGLTVALGPGLRARQIAARDIAAVDVVNVRPIAEFGGWGVRTGRGGVVGVVLRAGSALRVTTSDGRRFVVTVDDTATAAALLAGVALREQGATPAR